MKENYETIKNTDSEKSADNLPLRISSALLDALLNLGVELAPFREQEHLDSLLNIEELPSRSKLQFDAVKIMFATSLLTCLLYRSKTPRPPTYDEIAEASGVRRHRVERILRGKCSSLKCFYFINQIFTWNHPELDLKRLYPINEKNVKVFFVVKRAGRPPQPKILKQSMGRPSKLVVLFPKFPTAELYEALSEEDKIRLKDYMSSKPICDATQIFLMEFCRSLTKSIEANEESLKNFVKETFVDVVIRAVKIAERNDASIPEEIKEICKKEFLDEIWAQIKSCLNQNKMLSYVDAQSSSELQNLLMKSFEGYLPMRASHKKESRT
jgi:hypothetical protein